jgi:hypothetical protein
MLERALSIFERDYGEDSSARRLRKCGSISE